ncbi:MAG TPA: 5-formyltetrahydrofolate cyclo-ligase [Candidatus Acidoferrum sp.]|nr:5-formyltetrahydrofolate cyclo-ligase [Candidatus Acidoferrum sp.]
MSSKRELRREMIELRTSMGEANRARAEAMLAARLLGTAMWKKAGNLLLFNATYREVSTKSLIDTALNAGKKLYLPRIKDKDMEFYLVSSRADLAPGAFGIMEPVSKMPLPPDFDFDGTLCVVPALACDREGFRLGFGGGYYDRYLSKRNLRTVTIVYDRCIVDALPREAFDIPVDAILTERGFVYGTDWPK